MSRPWPIAKTGLCRPQIIKAYGAQSITASVAASLTKAGRDQLIRAALDQRELPIRFHLIAAEAGEIEYIDGVALLPSLNIENMARRTTTPSSPIR